MEKIRMALIATYPKLAEVFLNLTDGREDIISYNIYASFEEAARIAKEMEDSLDVILSRGGTAEYIRKAVNIPILSIPITPFDVVKAIHTLNPMPDSVALIHYSRNIRDVQDVASIFGIRIEEYAFENTVDIQHAVADAVSKGITTIIGGHVAVEIATGEGLRAIELSAGEEAMERAIDEAISLLSQVRTEQKRNARTQFAFNALKEGIVVTDNRKQVTLINKAASGLFQKRYKKGDQAGKEILSGECLSVYETRKEQPVYIRRIHKETYSVTHVPILRGDEFLGVVSRYENITRTEALEQKIRREVRSKGFNAQHHFEHILTKDPQMIMVRQQAELYALTDSTILILGESGTGKELFAQSIHNGSTRKNGPFVAVNCAAIPSTLLESELFGYEKGAFTGAQKEGKAGFFEMAHMGTLFLDEIGEVSMEVQTRLLRVLQEREIMRVGGDRIIPVDVRVITATNKNLEAEVDKGTFRRDLYYRLNVLQLLIPPLRMRQGDVALLAEQFARQRGCSPEDIEELLPLLERYRWPGNVRELENIIERYSVLNPFRRQGKFTKEALISAMGLTNRENEKEVSGNDRGEETYDEILTGIPGRTEGVNRKVSGSEVQRKKSAADGELVIRVPEGKTLGEIVKHVEYVVSKSCLERCGNNQEMAAKALGIGQTTLWRKCREDPAAAEESK